jgi:arylformamidase
MIIDISRALAPGTAVFPIDTPYHEEFVARIGPGCPVNVGKVTLSTHCGTHMDAPYHYDEAGAKIADLDLNSLVGPARVIDAQGSGGLCRPEDIAAALEGAPPRILLRLQPGLDPFQWHPDFRSLAVETIALLARHGVTLIGIDTASVDPETSKTLPSHMAARDAGMIIIENLVLDHVTPGDYELIALPLKFSNLDASPVRAVLRSL